MSRSTLLAACIFVLGLVAFLVLVTGGPSLFSADMSGHHSSLHVEKHPSPRIDIEPGTLITIEASTYIAPQMR